MKTLSFIIALTALLCSAARAQSASYTFSGTGSGTAGGVPFTGAAFTIELTGDAGDAGLSSMGFYVLRGASSTIEIQGIGFGAFTEDEAVFYNPDTDRVGFMRAGDFDRFFLEDPGTAFDGFTLVSSLGPVFVPGPALGVYQFVNEPSTLGNITFSAITDVTFTAVVIPEPSAALLGLTAAAGMMLTRRRRAVTA